MTTFTTEDREAMQIRDVEFGGFRFRFVQEGDEWVCRLPNIVMQMAEDMADALNMDKEVK